MVAGGGQVQGLSQAEVWGGEGAGDGRKGGGGVDRLSISSLAGVLGEAQCFAQSCSSLIRCCNKLGAVTGG